MKAKYQKLNYITDIRQIIKPGTTGHSTKPLLTLLLLNGILQLKMEVDIMNSKHLYGMNQTNIMNLM
jgi:hypothetical protein